MYLAHVCLYVFCRDGAGVCGDVCYSLWVAIIFIVVCEGQENCVQ